MLLNSHSPNCYVDAVSHFAITLITRVFLYTVYIGGGSNNDDLLLIIILVTFSALSLVIVFGFIFYVRVMRRRRLAVVQRAAGEVAGLDAGRGRLRYVRRASSSAPRLMSRSSRPHMFPDYGPARSRAYFPASWHQTPPRPNRDLTTYNDDLSTIVSANKMSSWWVTIYKLSACLLYTSPSPRD